MPSRTLLPALAVALALAGAGCGDEGADDVAGRRAAQARETAIEAGLDVEVADFLGLLARGDTATYEVRFPGPDDGTELVVRNRPPDRRVDVVADGDVVEVRQVVDGEAFTCAPAADDGWSCERTDALVEAPGPFTTGALERLGDALAARRDDHTFDIETADVAGVEATCLVTRVREGRESSELGSTGTICASPEGVVLVVDQGDERVEALAYRAGVDPADLERVDRGDRSG